MDELEQKQGDSNVTEQIDSQNQENLITTAENTKRNKKYRFVDSSIFAVLSVFGIFFMSFLLVFQVWLTPIRVVGTSMQPNFNTSVISETDEEHYDIVYYTKQDSYSTDDVVIVANTDNKYVYSTTSEINFIIKRVIALPGQTVRFYKTDESTSTDIYYEIRVFDENGNDTSYEDTFIKESMHFSSIEILEYSRAFETFSNIFFNALSLDSGVFAEYTVPEGEYFVMGDNRNISEDSRFFGTVEFDDIAGCVKLHIPYGQTVWQAIWRKITYSI